MTIPAITPEDIPGLRVAARLARAEAEKARVEQPSDQARRLCLLDLADKIDAKIRARRTRPVAEKPAATARPTLRAAQQFSVQGDMLGGV